MNISKINTQQTTRLSNRGFSIIEAILVVAILAILASLSTPAVTAFLQRQNEQIETNTLDEIEKAMAAFAAIHGRLPSDDPTENSFCNTGVNSTWAQCLTTVSNLSATQMETDPWEHERQYIMWEDTSNVFFGTPVSVYYATLMSRGVDQNAEVQTNVATQAIEPFIGYAAATDGGWWSNRGNRINNFHALEAQGDDFLIKFNNLQETQERYEITLERINAITNALTTYARTKANEAEIVGEANANRKTYFPRSDIASGSASDAASNYGNQVSLASMGIGDTIYNGNNQITRRNEMIVLMRILGLPDSFCCNALERIPGNEELEAGLYYYSNPRARTSTGCLTTRANASQASPRYLPARVSITPYACP